MSEVKFIIRRGKIIPLRKSQIKQNRNIVKAGAASFIAGALSSTAGSALRSKAHAESMIAKKFAFRAVTIQKGLPSRQATAYKAVMLAKKSMRSSLLSKRFVAGSLIGLGGYVSALAFLNRPKRKK